MVKISLFKDKFALLPEQPLPSRHYALVLTAPAELWEQALGPAFYLVEVQVD